MESTEGFINVTGGKIYWEAVGDGPQTPLLTLHGGPGFGHSLLVEPFKALANDRKVFFYDQLGCGKSDRPTDLGLWTVERFVEEIQILRKELGLEEIILWGGSWGTMLGVDYLLTKPTGIKAVILSSPCLSAKIWKDDADRLRKSLPAEVQSVLLEHENAGTTHSEAYQNAMWEYLKRFACVLDPIPDEIMQAFNNANHQIYHFMWGPSEFCPTGTLKNYDRTPELHQILKPTLFICGSQDEATPEATHHYASFVSGAKTVEIEGASHLGMLEKPTEYFAAIREFLANPSLKK